MMPLFVLAIEVSVVATALGHLCHSEPQLLAFTAFHTEGFRHLKPRIISLASGTDLNVYWVQCPPLVSNSYCQLAIVLVLLEVPFLQIVLP